MTNQEIFDKAAIHLLTQNAKALDNDEICKYRSVDGKMCAVGVLIPDEKYDKKIEGETVGSRPSYFRSIGFTEENFPVLKDLQYIHDETEMTVWRHELNRLATEQNLSPAILESIKETK